MPLHAAVTSLGDGVHPLPSELTFLHIAKNAGTQIEDLRRKAGLQWGRHVRFFRNTTKERWPASVCKPYGGIHTYDHCCGWWHLPPQLLQNTREFPSWWGQHLQYHSRQHIMCVLRDPIERLLSEYIFSGGGHSISERKALGPSGLLDKLMQTSADGINHRFSEWALDRVKQTRALPTFEGCHMLPQAWFIAPEWIHVSQLSSARRTNEKRTPLQTSPTTGTCNLVLRFSHLKEDFDDLMKSFGLGVRFPIRKGNGNHSGAHGWSQMAASRNYSQDVNVILSNKAHRVVYDFLLTG